MNGDSSHARLRDAIRRWEGQTGYSRKWSGVGGLERRGRNAPKPRDTRVLARTERVLTKVRTMRSAPEKLYFTQDVEVARAESRGVSQVSSEEDQAAWPD